MHCAMCVWGGGGGAGTMNLRHVQTKTPHKQQKSSCNKHFAIATQNSWVKQHKQQNKMVPHPTRFFLFSTTGLAAC